MTSYFRYLEPELVETLRRNDPAVDELRRMMEAEQSISFSWLRSSFMRTSDKVYPTLDRGRAVLDTVEKLDQYLWSYAPMIQSQWRNMAAEYPGDNASRIIDYGCGQGLAGLLLYDMVERDIFDDIPTIFLIEPSLVALIRAEAIYRSISPESEIHCVNKLFDHVAAADLGTDDYAHTVHLFSNVLDIEGFDAARLLGQSLSPGRHTILAVSHDRNSYGGSARIENLKAAIEGRAPDITIIDSTLDRFTCDNGSDAISWRCMLDVPDE